MFCVSIYNVLSDFEGNFCQCAIFTFFLWYWYFWWAISKQCIDFDGLFSKLMGLAHGLSFHITVCFSQPCCSPPGWCKSSRLNCGSVFSEDPWSIPSLPSPRVGPLMARRIIKTSWYPCQGRPGMLKTPSYPWHWVPVSRSKFGNWTLSCHYIA